MLLRLEVDGAILTRARSSPAIADLAHTTPEIDPKDAPSWNADLVKDALAVALASVQMMHLKA